MTTLIHNNTGKSYSINNVQAFKRKTEEDGFDEHVIKFTLDDPIDEELLAATQDADENTFTVDLPKSGVSYTTAPFKCAFQVQEGQQVNQYGDTGEVVSVVEIALIARADDVGINKL